MTASRALARSPMGADTRKFANLELRGLKRDGRFSGYASVFGEVDLGKDAIERGAFRKSLAERGAGGVRMLFQHDPAEPIGAWKTIEDSRGLYVEGMLAVGVARAREVHFDEFMETFEAFKDTNDRRLGEIEEKLTADVVTRDKMDRISRAMDEQKKVLDQLALKKARPPLGRLRPRAWRPAGWPKRRPARRHRAPSLPTFLPDDGALRHAGGDISAA
jgi:hypothetical protein